VRSGMCVIRLFTTQRSKSQPRFMRQIHDRMPIILDSSVPEEESRELAAVLGDMVIQAVAGSYTL